MRSQPNGGFLIAPLLLITATAMTRMTQSRHSRSPQPLSGNLSRYEFEVGPNKDFGLKVVEHVREHDVVHRVGP